MNEIRINQAASAMGVQESELLQLLARCGLKPEGGVLAPSDIDTLRRFLTGRSEEAQLQAEDKLARTAARFTLMIDTCSILHERFPLLMQRLVPLLAQSGKTLLVPSGVVEELKGLRNRPELTDRVNARLMDLIRLKRGGLIRVCGQDGTTFGDQQILAAATRALTTTELLVITQDNGLSEDLLQLNALNSVRGKRLAVSRINSHGFLSRYRTWEERSQSCGSFSDSRSTVAQPAQTAELIKGGEEPLEVSLIPSSGGDVQTGAGEVLRLGEALARGGEGTVYALEDGSVAKLYRPGRLTVGRRDKLERMVARPVRCEGVCWPLELLYNLQGEFVGYRMERARGKELQRCLFTRPALEASFPHWKKRDTVRLCVTILEKLDVLHSQGVILGDINPLNILVVSPEKVWFVDCDSYQIGGYPCPVGTPRFTAPELQGKNFRTLLRTPGNEAFAVATLLFMIMLPGKSPYAQQGGESLEETIRRMEFPYPCGDNGSTRTPDGSWRFLWSHLPRYLKEYFYHTFQKGGKYSEEGTRLTTRQWLRAFRDYCALLDSGKLQARDPESGEIFPTRWKLVNPTDREVVVERLCAQCGQSFGITRGERDIFRRRGYCLPTRCPDCRRLRKLERAGFSDSFSQMKGVS